MSRYFFDSHGSLWFDVGKTCQHAWECECAAFGPSGVATRADPMTLPSFPKLGETDYTAALRVGAVREVGEWKYMDDSHLPDVPDL